MRPTRRYFRGMQRPRFLDGRPSPVLVDAAVAIGACVVTVLELTLGSGIQGPAWVNAIGAAGATLPVAVRRRWPLGALVAVAAAVVFQEALDGDVLENTIAPVIAYPLVVYAVAAYCDRRRAFVGLVTALVLVWIVVLIQDHRKGGDFIFTALLVFGPWLVGRIVAARGELAMELRDKADRLQREAEEEAQAGVG